MKHSSGELENNQAYASGLHYLFALKRHEKDWNRPAATPRSQYNSKADVFQLPAGSYCMATPELAASQVSEAISLRRAVIKLATAVGVSAMPASG